MANAANYTTVRDTILDAARSARISPAWVHWSPHVESLALPKSIESGNLSLAKALIRWMLDEIGAASTEERAQGETVDKGKMMARVAVVTGGTRGIGAAVSKALAAQGYRVAANYHGNDQAAAKFAAETGMLSQWYNVVDTSHRRQRVNCSVTLNQLRCRHAGTRS